MVHPRKALPAALLGTMLATSLMLVTLPQPAAALTAELAKKCRALAVKAHPTQRAGGKSSSERSQRDYFQACVAKNGNMPDQEQKP
jgi:hypothetical protein